jgi:hypothetical protein
MIKPRGHVIFVQFAHPPKEEAVARQRIVGARAGENKSVIAAKGGNHDGDGHDGRASAGKNHVGRLRRNAIARRILDCAERERRQICDVGQKIKADHQKCAERE